MNKLTRLSEFQDVLKHYKHSANAIEVLQKTRLVLLVAPSSSGRSTVIRHLLKTGDYHFIISDTTRQPRTNDGVLEQNGREYWFRSEQDVLAELQAGEFLEAAVIHNQQVSGITIRELEKAYGANKIAITDIEVVGAENIYRMKPDVQLLFMVPPSFDEWLKRLHNRGVLPEDEIRRRLESAVNELQVALNADHYTFVVNGKIAETTELLYLMTKEKLAAEAEGIVGKMLAETLLHATKAYLAQY
jgi:guanylate kinase